MKIIFTIASLHPEHGGPSQSVPALAEALGRAGAEVEILTLHHGATWKPPQTPAADVVRTTFVDGSSAAARRLHWTPRFKAVLRERVKNSGAQIIHDHGLWLPTNHAAAQVARERGLPLVISPRGMLTEWSLQFKAWKKKLAWQLYQGRDVRGARVLHATSAAEAEGFRALGLRQPVAVIPNGVGMPPERQRSEGRSQRSEDRGRGANLISDLRSLTSGVRTVLFLSRIHPKKGLMDLVKAWAAIQKSEVSSQKSEVGGQPRWRVVVAGGDEGGHLQELKVEIGKLKLESCFEFIGPVEGAAKWEAYRSADIFVLPTYSENFGIVVAEALACGVPVITTRGTPWEDLLAHRCGWWCETGVEPLAAALREALGRTDAERRAMGARGRELVETKYTWPAAGKKMLAVYRWILDSGEKPEWIV